jgi:hypothetical protein
MTRPRARGRLNQMSGHGAVNTTAASFVLPSMSTGDPDSSLVGAEPEDDMKKPLHRRLSGWRSRGCRKHGAAADRAAPRAPAADEPGDTIATAMQLAIGLLTASLDSPQLEAWAAAALTPLDADGLGNFMAGLHVVSELLLHELHEATGEPPEATLQRLAIQAEQRRGGLPAQHLNPGRADSVARRAHFAALRSRRGPG